MKAMVKMNRGGEDLRAGGVGEGSEIISSFYTWPMELHLIYFH